MVIREGKDALCTPGMSIEGRPTWKEGIRLPQSIREALVLGRYIEQVGDLEAQASRTLLGDDQPRE
jgi:hypothetical protein